MANHTRPTRKAAPVHGSHTAQTRPKDFSKVLLLVFCALLFVLLALLVAPTVKDWLSALSQPRLAVVDLGSIMQARKARFVAMSKQAQDDTQREAAYTFIQNTSEVIRAATQTLAKECQCVILLRSAVLNPQRLPDLSERMQAIVQGAP